MRGALLAGWRMSVAITEGLFGREVEPARVWYCERVYYGSDLYLLKCEELEE